MDYSVVKDGRGARIRTEKNSFGGCRFAQLSLRPFVSPCGGAQVVEHLARVHHEVEHAVHAGVERLADLA